VKIKAIAFDLDDTLLRNDRSISDFTVETLRRAADRGIHVIPASGRTAMSMRAAVERIGCASCFISCNGAQVRRADHSLWMEKLLTVDFAREVADFAAGHACYAQCYDEEKFYYSMHGPYADEYAANSSLPGEYVGDLRAFITRPTPKILMMDSPGRIACLLQKAQALWAGRASVTCSKPYFLEVNPLGATKGEALAWCGRQLGFDLSEVVAFGDSLNDMSMLSAAGFGVAMDNARPEVKALVSLRCPDNQHDGVAHYLLSNVLTEEQS